MLNTQAVKGGRECNSLGDVQEVKLISMVRFFLHLLILR